MPPRHKPLPKTKRPSEKELKQAKLRRVFDSILYEWNLPLHNITRLNRVGKFLQVTDSQGVVRSIPDADNELLEAIAQTPAQVGEVKKFNPDGSLDRFA